MKNKRRVNKNLILALMAYGGLTHESAASLLTPPVSRVQITRLLLAGKSGNARAMEQLSDLLQPLVDDLVREVLHIDRSNLAEYLFPRFEHAEQPVSIQGGNHDGSPVTGEKEEDYGSQTGSSGSDAETGGRSHVGGVR